MKKFDFKIPIIVISVIILALIVAIVLKFNNKKDVLVNNNASDSVYICSYSEEYLEKKLNYYMYITTDKYGDVKLIKNVIVTKFNYLLEYENTKNNYMENNSAEGYKYEVDEKDLTITLTREDKIDSKLWYNNFLNKIDSKYKCVVGD